MHILALWDGKKKRSPKEYLIIDIFCMTNQHCYAIKTLIRKQEALKLRAHLAVPLYECGLGNSQPRATEDAFLPVERDMILVLGHWHPGKQSGGGDVGRDRPLDSLLGTPLYSKECRHFGRSATTKHAQSLKGAFP